MKRRGMDAEAARQFELVIERDPGEAEAYYQLALVYEKSGRKSDAIAALQRGLSQVKSQDLGDKISEALKSRQGCGK